MQGRDGREQELRYVGDPRLGAHRPQLDVKSDPLLWLDSRNILRDPRSGKLTHAQLQATRFASVYRFETGRMLQGIFRRAQVSSVRSFEYGMMVDSSIGGHDVTSSQLDALRRLKRLSARLGAERFALLRELLHEGKWLWEGKTSRERRDVYNDIRHALDHAAAWLGQLSFVDYRTRWP